VVARYLVGLLHARSPSFFDHHKPSSFSTAATPHLGVLKYQTTSNTLIHTIGRRLFSRSGQQLYCLDKDWEGRCLLEVLADPGTSIKSAHLPAISPHRSYLPPRRQNVPSGQYPGERVSIQSRRS
jgi:hypothetical protein